ncbi:MAG: hypothetical protein O2799_03835 [Planctomycetota bacterium]|nr:hypothetical protein [Planctomycetota bacterium]
MKNRLLPIALVLAPAVLGLLARSAEFATANGVLTASAGRVAPQEIASTLAAGDLILALGLAVSLALALVWVGAGAREGSRTWAPRALVAAGLLVAALGTLRLQALNAALADDYRATVAAAWTQPEDQALEKAEAYYSATYADERPVHASVQLAGLVAGSEGAFDGASKARFMGLLLAVAAFTTTLRRRSCRVQAAEA